MKTLILVIALIFAMTGIAQAGSATFSWTSSIVDATHDAAVGYRIYCGNSSGSAGYTLDKDVGDVNTCKWRGLASGVWYCSAIAYNTAGVSTFSNEVMKIVPVILFSPNVPTDFDFIINTELPTNQVITTPEED